jgi:hypothetical protein
MNSQNQIIEFRGVLTALVAGILIAPQIAETFGGVDNPGFKTKAEEAVKAARQIIDIVAAREDAEQRQRERIQQRQHRK